MSLTRSIYVAFTGFAIGISVLVGFDKISSFVFSNVLTNYALRVTFYAFLF